MEERSQAQSPQKNHLREKLVIVINGKGGAGKDTLCDIAGRYYNVRVISAITPIKEIAARCGWSGEKDNKARKLLSDLKRTFIEYNDLPNRYLIGEYQAFLQSDDDILFVHIREGDQIDAFKRRIGAGCVTLIVRSPLTDHSGGRYGNDSDDNVEDYAYDYSYLNRKPMDQLAPDFMEFLHEVFLREGVAL